MHCSAGDKLIGAAPVWASIIILLVIGFVVGLVVGFVAALQRQRHLMRHIAPELQNDLEQGQSTPVRGWLPGVLRLKRRNFTYVHDSPLAPGPLGARMPGTTEYIQPLRSGEEQYSSSPHHPPAHEPQQPVHAPDQPAGFSNGTQDNQIPLDAILGTQSSLPRTGSGIPAYTGPSPKETPRPSLAGSPSVDQAESQAAKAARKARDARAVGQSYEMDELNDDWLELLSQIDDQLLSLNKETLTSEERAIAIRTLLVSTAGEEPEVAMQHAIDAVERMRRFRRH